MSQENNTPELSYTANQIISNQLSINTWGIITLTANGNNTLLRVNLNASQNGNCSQDRQGITLADIVGGGASSNIEVSYIIMRNVADPTWLQNNFINFLKNRFAI